VPSSGYAARAQGNVRVMSEYRTPEEDTIGGHEDLDEDDEAGSAAADEERVEPADEPD
jgi:hypothetical protein